jgi:V8-like Glu-specific endopeptidase
VRTCRTYRKGVLVKRCVTRRGHRRCVRPAGAHARAAALNWVGWLNGIREVGKILSVTASDRGSSCTGTVVSRSLVLTAAHCVYTSGVGYHKEIHFVPAAKQNGTSYTMPYGRWDATRWWVPNGYRTSGDWSLDYALVEIAPQNGRAIGDVVGAYGISYGASAFSNGRTYLVGYPASGWFAADGRNGFSQYACDSTYDSHQQIGSGYRLWSACYMNRGASGGPWFVPASDGTWSVAGVNSTCDGNVIDATHYCDPWATRLSTSFFDNRIVQFWNSVASLRGTNS